MLLVFLTVLVDEAPVVVESFVLESLWTLCCCRMKLRLISSISEGILLLLFTFDEDLSVVEDRDSGVTGSDLGVALVGEITEVRLLFRLASSPP